MGGDEVKKGSRVEVNLDEPGFRGSWYTGTVIRPASKSGKKKIWVEFENLADEQQRRLREQVDLICVRPAPPTPTVREGEFQLNDDVDAFHKDGWWEGVVTAIHPPPSPPPGFSSTTIPPTYSVFFRTTREQIQFPESDLRLHREWVNGNWVPPISTPIA